jgi:hypothetical protein
MLLLFGLRSFTDCLAPFAAQVWLIPLYRSPFE